MAFCTNCRKIVILLLVLCGIAPNHFSIAQGTWNALTNSAPHYNAGVMLLLPDGTVMCKTSSSGTYGKVWDKLTPDATGSYANGTWTSLAAMADDRLYFSSQVLRDGRVYVAGGEYGSGGYKGEVYNPLTNTWTPCPALSGGEFISDANSDLLPDGRVLQAIVGSGSRRTYLYNPVNNTYTTGPTALGSHNESAWAKLPDNSILYVDIFSTNSERYIPATSTWISDATVPVGLYDPYGKEMGGCTLLPDGRVFFIGGYGQHALYTPSGSTTPGSWSAAVATPSEGAPDAASSICVDGKVLLVLSPLPTSADHFPTPTKFYEYDYVTNTMTPVLTPTGGTLAPHRAYITNMLALPDGTVLYCNQGDDQYYQYTPAGAPLAVAKPTISTITRINCDTFRATGTLFNGITQGASYGDDWQMNTNYPLIRLKSGSNVYYTRTRNWNSTGVMRGSAPDTTEFILPAGLPVGTYTLEVVANGVASDLTTINTGLSVSPTSASVCQGLTTNLTGSWSDGSWTSSNVAIATVDGTGEVTGVAGGTAVITYSFGTCYVTANVTVNPMAPITPTVNVSVCEASATLLSNAMGGGSWSSSDATIASVSGTGNVSGVLAGVATITYTATTGCYAIKDITVNLLPGATITSAGSTIICSGGSVMLNANTGTGYTYQWRLAASPISGATNSTFLASTGGSYSVVVTNPNGCTSTSAVTVVTISSAPPAVITPSSSTTFCTGGSVVLNASLGAGYTYQWKLGGSNITGATASTYTATAAGGYSVVVTNGAGCSATSGTTPVTITPGPGATITPAGPTTFCAPGSVVLNANTGAGITYQWQVGGVNIPGATASSYTATTSGNYTVIVTQGACVVTSAAVTVTAITTSAGAIVGPTGVCIGQTIILSSTVSGGSWTSSNPSLATVGSTGAVTGIAAGSVLISYTVSNACGTVTSTTTIGVSAGTAVAAISGATSVCPGGNTLLADATPGGTWTSSNTAIATASSTTGLISGIAAGTVTISYNVTSALGCISSATMVMNVVSPFTATITPAGPTTFCTGAYVILNSSTGSGMRYQWKKNGANIPGATTASFMANTTGSYTVVMTATSGCNSTSASVAVTVNPGTIVVPGVVIAATPGTLFCTATSPTTFTASPTLGEPSPAYQWYVNGTPVGTGATYSYTPTAGDVVKCVLTSSMACAFPATASARDTIKVTTPRTPAVSITSGKPAVCTGDTVTYSAVPVYGGTAPSYTWAENGIFVGGGPSYRYSPTNGDRLVVTMTSNYPCVTTSVVNSTSYTVNVQSILPNTISIHVTKASITSGMVDTFIAIAPYAGSSLVYQWYINGLPIAGATSSMYIAYALVNGQEISCRVTSSNPCVYPATVHSAGVKVQVFGVGVQEMSQQGVGLTLVPNPNNGTFIVDGTVANYSGKVTIAVTNIIGQTVYHEIVEANNGVVHQRVTLNQGLSNGTYLVSVTTETDHAVFHMTLNK